MTPEDRTPEQHQDDSPVYQEVKSDHEKSLGAKRKKLAIAIGAGVAALLTTTTAIFGFNRFSENLTTEAIPASSAPAKPDATTTSDSSNPTPSSMETSPSVLKLPFDRESVAIMKRETADEFMENNGEKKRISYVLSEQYTQVNERSDYGQLLDQTLPDGTTVSDHNLLKQVSLTKNARPQEVMNSYVFGQLYATAHKDAGEGVKMLSTVVRNPNSKVFKELQKYVERNAGGRVRDRDINNPNYVVADAKRETLGNGETQLTTYTQGGFKETFIFVPVPGLETANENVDDDSEEVGVWLATSSVKGKVSFDF